jgi:hypothetical protein
MKEFKFDNEPKITSGFKTPERYFDDLSERINEKIKVDEPKVIPFYHNRKTWIYSVAAILVLSLSIPFVNYFQNNQSLDAEFLENYIAQNTTISEYDLLELLEKEDLKKITIDLDIQDEILEETVLKDTNLEHNLTY